MSELQKIKHSIASLLRKEFALRIPADGTAFTVTYWDFQTGANVTITTALHVIRNVYTHPVSAESEMPFCVVQDANLDHRGETQQKQDENINLEIAIYAADMDLDILDQRLEHYAEIVRDILNDYEDQIRTKNRLIKLTTSNNRFSITLQTESGFIRPVHIFLNIRTTEA